MTQNVTYLGLCCQEHAAFEARIAKLEKQIASAPAAATKERRVGEVSYK